MPQEAIRVIWSEAETSQDITQAIGEALAPYAPGAVLHVSHAMAHKPDPSIVSSPGEPRFLYSALILVREIIPD